MPLSKRNRRGAFWTLLISTMAVVAPRVYMHFWQPDVATSISHLELVTLEEDLLDAEKERYASNQQHGPKKYHAPPKIFDPNAYTAQDWMRLGLSQKQADVIVRYAERGIYSNDELQKIFVLPEAVYQLIKDSTIYPVRPVNKQNTAFQKEKVLLDINSASAADLEKIPGIGPYFAARIVQYREQLGGYIGKEQLLEIKRFDNEKLASIDAFIFLKVHEIEQMDINSADYESLKAHPYISWEVANSIVKMRMHTPFTQLEDIKRSKLIDEALFQKLKPYLKVQ